MKRFILFISILCSFFNGYAQPFATRIANNIALNDIAVTNKTSGASIHPYNVGYGIDSAFSLCGWLYNYVKDSSVGTQNFQSVLSAGNTAHYPSASFFNLFDGNGGAVTLEAGNGLTDLSDFLEINDAAATAYMFLFRDKLQFISGPNEVIGLHGGATRPFFYIIDTASDNAMTIYPNKMAKNDTLFLPSHGNDTLACKNDVGDTAAAIRIAIIDTANAIRASAGAGSVTSVGLSMPPVFSVTPTPITSTGTFSVSFNGGQTANQFLGTPNSSTGAVGLRSIVAADIPTLNQSTTGNAANITGNLSISNLNSGSGASSSAYWRGDGTWATPPGATYSAGSGLTLSGTTFGVNNFAYPTSTKTGNYNALRNDLVIDSTVSQNDTTFLPSSPADSSIVGVKLVFQTGSFIGVIKTQGTDTINLPGGSTIATLQLPSQAIFLLYKASKHLWYVLSDLPLSQLDKRYAPAADSGTVRMVSVSASGGISASVSSPSLNPVITMSLSPTSTYSVTTAHTMTITATNGTMQALTVDNSNTTDTLVLAGFGASNAGGMGTSNRIEVYIYNPASGTPANIYIKGIGSTATIAYNAGAMPPIGTTVNILALRLWLEYNSFGSKINIDFTPNYQ